MRYTNKLTATLLSMSLLISLALGGLVACSGGDDSSVPPPPADTIDNTNIQSYSQSIANNVFLTNTSSASTSSSYTSQLATAYTKIGDAIATQNIPPGNYSQSITNELVQVYDQLLTICNSNNSSASHVSGFMSLAYHSSVDFSFSGTVSFNQLCFDDGQANQITLNGGVSFSGNQDSITVDFNNFAFTANGQSNIIDCSVSLSGSGTTTTCGDITNAVINYTNNADNSLLSGITVSSDANGSYVNISGSINTANGYLNINTDTPLKICGNGSGGFESGLLLLNGSNSTQATLDFTDPSCSTATWCISDGNGGQTCDVVSYR